MPLTLFTTTKAFIGSVAVAQRNALGSWQRLASRLGFDIILIGNDSGAPEAASQYGAHHIPDVATSASGAPLLNDMFALARQQSRYDTLAYINADIILFDDFEAIVKLIQERSASSDTSSLFITGRRFDVLVDHPIDFSQDNWADNLFSRSRHPTALDAETALDLFVFSRTLYPEIPPLAIGRTAWDNWLLAEATRRKAAIIDATPAVTLLHQCHDYAHLPGNWLEAWNGAEAERNRSLAGEGLVTLSTATSHTLERDGLRHGASGLPTGTEAVAVRKFQLALQSKRICNLETAWQMALESLTLAGERIYHSPELSACLALAPLKKRFLEKDLADLSELKQMGRNVLKDWFKTITEEHSRALCVWGAGAYGRSISSLLSAIGYPRPLVVDSNPAKWDREINGLAIADPRILDTEQNVRSFVIIGTMYRESARAALTQKGYQPAIDFV